jgi:hypothetical protein
MILETIAAVARIERSEIRGRSLLSPHVLRSCGLPATLARKPPESGARNSRSNACLKIEMAKAQTKQFVVCLSNEGHPASLEKRKIYVALRDAVAECASSEILRQEAS